MTYRKMIAFWTSCERPDWTVSVI